MAVITALACLVVACASSSKMQQSLFIDVYTLASVSPYMDVSSKVAIYLNSPLLMRDHHRVYAILYSLKVKGRFKTIAETVDDLIHYNLPELEYVIPSTFNPFNHIGHPVGLVSIMTSYLAGLSSPLWKYLPISWRNDYHEVFRPGPSFDITLGDVDLVDLDSVYATLASHDGNPGRLGPRRLEVDQTLDKQMFIFTSYHTDLRTSLTEMLLVDKATGQSAWYTGAVWHRMHLIPSSRVVIFELGGTRSLWYIRADTRNGGHGINRASDRWILHIADDSVVDLDLRIEIPLDYHKHVVVGARSGPAAGVAPAILYPQHRKLGAIAHIDDHGVITVRNTVNSELIELLKDEVRLFLPMGMRYFGSCPKLSKLQQLIDSGYEWNLVRQFAIDIGFSIERPRPFGMLCAFAEIAPCPLQTTFNALNTQREEPSCCIIS